MDQTENKLNGNGQISESFWDELKGEFAFWRFVRAIFTNPDEPVEWPKSDE